MFVPLSAGRILCSSAERLAIHKINWKLTRSCWTGPIWLCADRIPSLPNNQSMTALTFKPTQRIKSVEIWTSTLHILWVFCTWYWRVKENTAAQLLRNKKQQTLEAVNKPQIKSVQNRINKYAFNQTKRKRCSKFRYHHQRRFLVETSYHHFLSESICWQWPNVQSHCLVQGTGKMMNLRC